MTVADKLTKPGPRKLLALDGGGIRGLITIEVLAEIERLLKDEPGAGDDFVLAEYFDYIAGTSTGAVIATCLVGRDVRRPDPRVLSRERRGHVRQVPLARPLPLQVRGRSARRAAAEGARRGDDARERAAADAPARRHAQCDDGFPVAPLQQPGGVVQPTRAGVPEPRHPALAARARKHGSADVLPARGDRHRRRASRSSSWTAASRCSTTRRSSSS